MRRAKLVLRRLTPVRLWSVNVLVFSASAHSAITISPRLFTVYRKCCGPVVRECEAGLLFSRTVNTHCQRRSLPKEHSHVSSHTKGNYDVYGQKMQILRRLFAFGSFLPRNSCHRLLSNAGNLTQRLLLRLSGPFSVCRQQHRASAAGPFGLRGEGVSGSCQVNKRALQVPEILLPLTFLFKMCTV